MIHWAILLPPFYLDPMSKKPVGQHRRIVWWIYAGGGRGSKCIMFRAHNMIIICIIIYNSVYLLLLLRFGTNAIEMHRILHTNSVAHCDSLRPQLFMILITKNNAGISTRLHRMKFPYRFPTIELELIDRP